MAKRNTLFLVLIFFICGTFLGFFLQYSFSPHSQNAFAAMMIHSTIKNCPYHYINPLRCEPDLTKRKKDYTPLQNALNEFVEEKIQDGNATNIAVYFRDLNDGPIITIGKDEQFDPASLLKIPLMITYFKKAENDPSVLQRKTPVAGNFSLLPKQDIPPKQSAIIGKEYTINELINLLITQSDNISWEALLTDLRKNYSEDDFISTLSDLGIIDPRKSADDQFVTVQDYASIFRILYNSSYLNIPMSDKTLNLLTQSNFTDGIVAGIPPDIKVAHKYGEQVLGNEQQFHDCGIVYYPSDPYILCIMTKGNDMSVLEGIIQQISQEVFNEVKNSN